MNKPFSLVISRSAGFTATIFVSIIVLFMSLLILNPSGVAYAAPILTNQCNDVDNTGGLAIECDVTVTNNLDQATGIASSVVTVRECHGAAGEALICVDTTTTSVDLVASVTQCNGSTNGGGATLDCSVTIINNIIGTGTLEPATVNQCIGSGEDGGIEPTTICDPVQETTGATVTQCNGSGNGGGGSLRVDCTVLTSTQTSALPVTVNQCNGSSNGGGSTVICDVQITNNITPAVVVPPVDDDDDTTGDDDGTTGGTGGTNGSENTTGGSGDTTAKTLPVTGFDPMPLAFGSGFLLLGLTALLVAKRRAKLLV